MTANPHPVHLYSEEVLAFSFGGRAATLPPLPPEQDTGKALGRCLAAFRRSRKKDLVLLGLGSGTLAALLAERLPPEARLFVCELSVEAAQVLRAAGRLTWRTPAGRAQLIADTSPWAHLVLLGLLDVNGRTACLLPNPEVPAAGRKRLAALHRLLAQAQPRTIRAKAAGRTPSLGVAAILKPDEPGLPAFLAQIPAWAGELVLVWDAKDLPGLPLATDIPVRQTAHPLDHDFAAQRNRMLAACASDWVLYLDADERLDARLWNLLPALLATPRVQAWSFPRQTFFPDAARCRIGLGLWPDLQLRLFRRQPGLTFERPVHERLVGLRGAAGIALDAGILHLTHLSKGPEEIAAKLRLFDKAAGGAIRHTLNPDLPNLPCQVLDGLSGPQDELRCLVLPEGLG